MKKFFVAIMVAFCVIAMGPQRAFAKCHIQSVRGEDLDKIEIITDKYEELFARAEETKGKYILVSQSMTFAEESERYVWKAVVYDLELNQITTAYTYLPVNVLDQSVEAITEALEEY